MEKPEAFDAFSAPRTTAAEVARRLDEAFPEEDEQCVEECSLENAGLDADAI
jgi:hypothetical protein